MGTREPVADHLFPGPVEALLERCGIAREYLDYRKIPTHIPSQARLAVLRCLGFASREDAVRPQLESLECQEWLRWLPATLVLRSSDPLRFPVSLPREYCSDGHRLMFRIVHESGDAREQVIRPQDCEPLGERQIDGRWYSRRAVSLGPAMPPGHHALQVVDGDGLVRASCALLVAPDTCYQPPALCAGKRVYGISVQLYTLRTARNWGMGDFSDLATIVGHCAALDMDVIGLNPLHALFPANPHHFSPYSPSSRAFLNVLYVDPEACADFAECEDARRMVADAEFRQRLSALRARSQVDYPGVAACKFAVLEMLFGSFRRRHLSGDTARAAAYRRFVAAQGEALRLHATFDALHEHFLGQDAGLWGWPVWPAEFRDPAGLAVREFAASHADRIEYFQYLQWCAHEQLSAVQALARDAGMAIGIYLDLAVGVDQAGSEAWTNQAQFCFAASAGAPPDGLARDGQDWGFPPLLPAAMRESGYALFVRNLRANMALAGAVRFDHAVSLLRLWWIPRPGSAADGAYVAYPLDDLLGVLALESVRNRCLVIGEDLGTVPVELTETMQRNHAFSYGVLYFEKTDLAMIPPCDYPREAVTAVSTHDLPTLASWWAGSDIDLRAGLGLYPDAAVEQDVRGRRVRDRQHLLDALCVAGCWEGERNAARIPELDEALNEAIHAWLAAGRSAVMILQIEDLMRMHDPVNVPGTFREYPNWLPKLALPLEGFFDRPDVRRLCARVRAARGIR